VIAGIAALLPRPAPAQAACAFPFTPTTYEDLKNRQIYLQTIELAGFNMLFPGDPFFGVPDLDVGARQNRGRVPGKVPPVILKAIDWVESGITQAAGAVPYGAIGPALISFDCGHGIAQVTSGMTVPAGEAGRGSPQQALVATNFAYNIARGAAILAAKWNAAPEDLPIAGINSNGQPEIMENWYFAIWAYNGFTGPGANRSNHPLDPIYGAWPRLEYSCGPENDGKGHNRGTYPYQELVIGCAANPPVVDGQALWQGQPITPPDLNDNQFKTPLALSNFVYPYVKMDIPSPQPFHADMTPDPNPGLRDAILGYPELSIGTPFIRLGFTPGSGSTSQVVKVLNSGTGVMTWYATPSVPWLFITPYTGAAVGTDRPCAPDVPCDRTGQMEITVDANKAPPGRSRATITVQALGTNQQQVINVEVAQVIRIGVPGVTRN
jgi:hypothetical protein